MSIGTNRNRGDLVKVLSSGKAGYKRDDLIGRQGVIFSCHINREPAGDEAIYAVEFEDALLADFDQSELELVKEVPISDGSRLIDLKDLKIYVVVKGGTVIEVWSPIKDHNVEVVDWDDAEADDEVKTEVEQTVRKIEKDHKAGILFPVY